MKNHKTVIVGLLLLLVLAGCGAAATETPTTGGSETGAGATATTGSGAAAAEGDTMAIVKTEDQRELTITVAEFTQLYDRAAAGGQAPPADEVLQVLVAQEIALDRARQAGVGIEGSEVDEIINNLQSQSQPGSPDLRTTEGLDEFAKSNGFESGEALRAFLVEQLTIREQASQELPESQVHARHILFAKDIDQSKPAEEQQEAFAKNKETADQVYAQLQGGADFAELAIQHSDDPGSGKNGGDLGFISRGQTVEPFENALFALKENEISQPVQSQFGWHIIQRLEGAVAPQEMQQWLQGLYEQAQTENRIEIVTPPSQVVPAAPQPSTPGDNGTATPPAER